MTDTWETAKPESWGRSSGPRAGFWRRFGGAIIDGLIVGVVGGIVETVVRLAAHSAGAGDGVGVLISAGYFTYFEGSRAGAGFGKQAVGIRVIDANTGEPIGHGRAFVRWITALISTLFIFLGYLWMLWDPERQCWHDKFAGDVVVPTADYPVVPSTPERGY